VKSFGRFALHASWERFSKARLAEPSQALPLSGNAECLASSPLAAANFIVGEQLKHL
jgi:hypothetical protein